MLIKIMYLYPDFSIEDRCEFNLNFGSMLGKTVHHLCMRLSVLAGLGFKQLGGIGRPRI